LHIRRLYIDFGNSCHLNSYDDELAPTVIIGLRIAYVFFVEGKYNMTFEIFRGRVLKYNKYFKISNVFECICEHLNLQPKQQLFVFLHIDEFQLIDRWECDAVNKRKMIKRELFKEMIHYLAGYMPGPSHIFIQTFLSGTAPRVVISAKKPTSFSFRFVNCPQLSLRAMLKIANHYAQKFGAKTFDDTYKWMIYQPFLQLLEDTGGLPHALQYVFEECFKIESNAEIESNGFFNNIYQQNFNTIFGNVKRRLQERYNIYKTIEMNKKLALELLYHSIDAIPVRYKTCLDPSDQNCTIENLERDAHIILNSCDITSSEFIIKMPFFFICIYNDKLKVVNRELEEVFRVQSWETFVANYDAFRTNLLIKRGKKSARLNELYRGAHGTQSTLNIEVELKELMKLTDKESSNSIDWVKSENVIVNGTSQHIKIVITIQPFDDTISTNNNCLAITKNNFKEYFGPIFASRATFLMTKDDNPNFSDCS
jgi:hypothetical protein